MLDDAPDECEEEHEVVDEDGLLGPLSQARPGYQDEVSQEQQLQLQSVCNSVEYCECIVTRSCTYFSACAWDFSDSSLLWPEPQSVNWNDIYSTKQ